jgi:hypothetical protein
MMPTQHRAKISEANFPHNFGVYLVYEQEVDSVPPICWESRDPVDSGSLEEAASEAAFRRKCIAPVAGSPLNLGEGEIEEAIALSSGRKRVENHDVSA